MCTLNFQLMREPTKISVFKEMFVQKIFLKHGVYFIKNISLGLANTEHLPNYELKFPHRNAKS